MKCSLLHNLSASLAAESHRYSSSLLYKDHHSAIYRIQDRIERSLDLQSIDTIDRVAASLKEKFDSHGMELRCLTEPTSSVEYEKLKIRATPPSSFFSPSTVTIGPSMEIDVPNKNLYPQNSVISVDTKTLPNKSSITDSHLPRKKPRNTVYGKPTKPNDMDALLIDEDDDCVIAHMQRDLGFKTARQKFDEDRARDGKPPLATTHGRSDMSDKKRPRTIEEMAGYEDDDLEPPTALKKRASVAQLTSSIVSKTNKATPLHPKTLISDAQGAKGQTAEQSKLSKPAEAGTEVYKGVDPEIADRVLNEILDTNMNVKWTDIAGLEDVKQTLREMIILPNLHPEMFTGLRAPPRGLLLFGPPGNGKTLIAKAIATEAGLTFFSISASSLTSKWIGEGEKTMRALFTIAKAKAPSFIFIDEVDSILCSRGGDEHESSRRLKNEFLTQFDGATSSPEEAVTIMGATNRPFDLDEAARRRMPKRIYVPLPEHPTRYTLLSHLLKGENHCLSDAEVDSIASRLHGYSCNDIHHLSQQAAMGPVRDKMRSGQMAGELRPINAEDFQRAIETTRPSVAPEDCKLYEDFAEKFGTRGL